VELGRIMTCNFINHIATHIRNSIVNIYFDMTMSTLARYHSPCEVYNKHLDIQL